MLVVIQGKDYWGRWGGQRSYFGSGEMEIDFRESYIKLY